jgi:protein SCO1
VTRARAWACAWAAASGLACAPSTSAAGPAGASGAARPAQAVALFDEPWLWTDERGEAVALSKWRGTPAIVTMFYASCTFRCPLTLAKLKRVEAAFARRNLPVAFFLVTLDPRADTPDRLLEFKRHNHLSDGGWHLLAGAEGPTRALGHLLGVRPSYGDPHIDHDVKVAVVDASGLLLQTLDGWHFDEDAVVDAENPARHIAPPRADPVDIDSPTRTLR